MEDSRLAQSIYGKNSLTPQKLQQKVSQMILVGLNILFNILKVYQSLTSGKMFFFKIYDRLKVLAAILAAILKKNTFPEVKLW